MAKKKAVRRENALADFSRTPYDITNSVKIFADLYEALSKYYFSTLKGDSSMRTVTSAYAKALEEMTVKPGDETNTKGQLQKDLESREKLPKEESSEVLAKNKISQMQILDSYSPMYEFED